MIQRFFHWFDQTFFWGWNTFDNDEGDENGTTT